MTRPSNAPLVDIFTDYAEVPLRKQIYSFENQISPSFPSPSPTSQQIQRVLTKTDHNSPEQSMLCQKTRISHKL